MVDKMKQKNKQEETISMEFVLTISLVAGIIVAFTETHIYHSTRFESIVLSLLTTIYFMIAFNIVRSN